MQLPNAVNAVVSEDKVVNYLLNLAHRDGAAKARYFESLGFCAEEWQLLAGSLRQLALDSPITGRMESSHGVKYVVDGQLSTPTERTPLLRTVWIMDGDSEIPRLVTAYPHRK